MENKKVRKLHTYRGLEYVIVTDLETRKLHVIFQANTLFVRNFNNNIRPAIEKLVKDTNEALDMELDKGDVKKTLKYLGFE